MKLKYININGHGVLVDEISEIKEENWYVFISSKMKSIPLILKWGNDPIEEGDTNTRNKIIFAEKELNLDVPILPNWRDTEMTQRVPKYIVMDSEDTCDVKNGCCCSQRDVDCQLHSIKPKLTSNSEGIIKEII